MDLDALHTYNNNPNHKGGVGLVKLFDVTRGLPQRIEGQYRRNWSLAPALWNLYFRERINLGASLRVRAATQPGVIAKEIDTDMAEAAVGLYEKLDSGTWIRLSRYIGWWRFFILELMSLPTIKQYGFFSTLVTKHSLRFILLF